MNLQLFQPNNFIISVGGLPITGISNTSDAVSFASINNVSDIQLGQNSATILYSANAKFRCTLKLNAADPACTILSTVESSLRYANSADVPPVLSGITSIISAGSKFIPFTIVPKGNLTFGVRSLAWTVQNLIDLDVPYDATDRFERTFIFIICDEIQNQLGALSTVNT